MLPRLLPGALQLEKVQAATLHGRDARCRRPANRRDASRQQAMVTSRLLDLLTEEVGLRQSAEYVSRMAVMPTWPGASGSRS